MCLEPFNPLPHSPSGTPTIGGGQSKAGRRGRLWQGQVSGEGEAFPPRGGTEKSAFRSLRGGHISVLLSPVREPLPPPFSLSVAALVSE